MVNATFEMTLTTMGCPLTDMLDADIKQALSAMGSSEDPKRCSRIQLHGTSVGARNVLVGMLRWHWAFISTRLLPLLKSRRSWRLSCSLREKRVY